MRDGTRTGRGGKRGAIVAMALAGLLLANAAEALDGDDDGVFEAGIEATLARCEVVMADPGTPKVDRLECMIARQSVTILNLTELVGSLTERALAREAENDSNMLKLAETVKLLMQRVQAYEHTHSKR